MRGVYRTKKQNKNKLAEEKLLHDNAVELNQPVSIRQQLLPPLLPLQDTQVSVTSRSPPSSHGKSSSLQPDLGDSGDAASY
jgi:hypothetical protein